MIPKYDQYRKVRVPKKKNGRTCGVCGKALSKKNPNDYCWCHTMKGFEIENTRHIRKQYEASRDGRLKRMRERANEK